jgi:hypothetical protein
MRASCFILALAAGCGSGPNPGPLDASSPSDGIVYDLSPDADNLGPHWMGNLGLPFDGELRWADGPMATGPVSAANFSGGVGTIVYHGQTVDAAIYREIPFAPYDLAAIVASTASNIIVLYAYCQNGAVANWYYESLDEPVTVQFVSTGGFCTLMHTPTQAEMIFDVFNNPPNDLQHIMNATVTGTNVMIDQGTGTATISGKNFQVTPFDWVDCSACPGGPWWEIHSLLRSGPQVSFGIFYLIGGDTANVDFEYGFRFDVPGNSPGPGKIPATWVIH